MKEGQLVPDGVAMPSLGPATPPKKRGRSPTSGYLWGVLIATGGALIAFQVPRIIDRLERDVPSDLREDLNSPDVLRLAVSVGAYASVAVYLLVMLFYCLLGRLLENRSGVGSVWSLRKGSVGPVFVGIALTTVPFHLVGLITGEPLPKGSVVHLTYLVACGVLTVLLARRAVGRSPQMSWRPWVLYLTGAVLILMTGLI